MSLRIGTAESGMAYAGRVPVAEARLGTQKLWPGMVLKSSYGMRYHENSGRDYSYPWNLAPSNRIAGGYWQAFSEDRGFMTVTQGNYAARSTMTGDYMWITPSGSEA